MTNGFPKVGDTYASTEKRSFGKAVIVEEPACTSRYGFVWLKWKDSGRCTRVSWHYFPNRFVPADVED